MSFTLKLDCIPTTGTATMGPSSNQPIKVRPGRKQSSPSRYTLPISIRIDVNIAFFQVGGNMPGRGAGERLVIDPNNNQVLYLGARSGNGLWKSTNAGSTWSRVTSFTATGTYADDPTDTQG
jgi:hypothetical protein